MPTATIEETFAPLHTRRGTLRCRVCRATVGPAPDEEWMLPFWEGYTHLTGHPWECGSCERAFLSPSGLKRHTVASHL